MTVFLTGIIQVNAQLITSNGKVVSESSSMFLSYSASDSYNATIESFKSSSSINPGAMLISMGENSDAFLSLGREGGGVEFDEKLRILSNGNIGIGSSSPTSRLEIQASSGSYPNNKALKIIANGESPTFRDHITLESSSSSGYGLAFAGNGHHRGGIYAENFGGQSSTGKLTIWSRSSGDIILDGGRIGIGINNPSEKLEISGNVAIDGKIINKSNSIFLSYSASDSYNPTIESFKSSSSSNPGAMLISMGENNGAFLAFGREGSGVEFDEKMRIAQSGQVGIGTIEMGSHKLAVEGTIGAREIKVEASGWSDFVFYENYELKTLEEVEEHIKENGHLPEIPSEAEVSENGINLGEMDAKLLQKIEELTLYMIDMNRRMNQLETENQELKEEISTLKNY